MSRNYQSKLYRQVDHVVEQLYSMYPNKFKELSTCMIKYQRRQMKLQEVYERLVVIFQDDPALLKSYNDTLHTELKIRNNNTSNELETIFNTIFKSLNENFQSMFHQVVDLIAQIAKKSLNKEDTIIKKIKKLKKLVNEYPNEQQLPQEIKVEITSILDNFLKSRPPYQKILSEADDKETLQEDNFDMNYYENDYYEYKEPKSKLPKNVKRSYRAGKQSHAQMLKNEGYFFETLKNNLSQYNYINLIKMIHLYTNCVISYEELYKISENILRNLDKQMWLGFKEIIESRDNARKKTNPLYQGAGDIEDKISKFGPTFNQSYKKIPGSFPFFRNSTWDKIARENINVSYVSCPLGADKNTAKKPYDEGVIKKIFLKNTFEEMLFHIEDERFELDINIAKFRMVIKWLEMLSDPNISAEREDFLYSKILKFDVLQKIYTNKTEEYFTAVKEHKDVVLPKVQARVKEALDVILECKKKYEEDKWDETIQKNFYRSLDTKSFSLKYYERRHIVVKNFTQEVPKRITNIKSIHNDLKRLLMKSHNIKHLEGIKAYRRMMRIIQPYNSFFGISKTVKCYSNKKKQSRLAKPILDEEPNLNIPVFSFSFNKKKIAEDTMTIIHFYLTYGKSANTDKVKIAEQLETILEQFLSIKPQKTFDDKTYFSDSFLEELSKMENTLYPKEFSYANCVKESYSSKNGNKNNNNKDDKGKNEKNDDDEENKDDDNMDEEDSNKDKEDGDDEESDEDSFDKLIEESSNDSNKEILSKMMKYQPRDQIESTARGKYAHTKFIPRTGGTGKLFYGGQNFYVCYRFFYSLYERFLKAWELSMTYKDGNTFTEEEKKEMTEKRYNFFKNLLMSVIKENLDTALYEDSLRCIFGKEAGIFFSTDKILNNVLKSLPNDDFGTWVIDNNKNLFSDEEEDEEFSDIIKFSKAMRKLVSMTEHKAGRATQTTSSNMLSSIILYRLYLDVNENILYINVHNNMFKHWSHKGMRHCKKYFDNFVTSQTPSHLSVKFKHVFLKKNLKDGKKNFQQKQLFIRNRIAYKTLPNTVKLIPSGHGTEDIFFRKNQKRDQKKFMKATIKKVVKFRQWLNKNKPGNANYSHNAAQ